MIAVGMFDSPHFANWLSLHSDQAIDFRLVPSSPHRKIHPTLSSLGSGSHSATYTWSRLISLVAVPLWLLDKVFGKALGSLVLSRTVRAFQPHFIHALELQNAGYIALRALQCQDANASLIVTNYGSDIYWFSRFPKHLAKIRALLTLADRYACECKRDVGLALALGFSGRVMPVQPNSGYFPREILEMELPRCDQRDVILIKGYHGWAGRALVALSSVESLAPALQDFRIVIYSSNLVTKLKAWKTSRISGIRIDAYGKGSLTREKMLELFAQSIIYVGLSRTDGISTSLLEAMALGAIPVQTSTACCDEWFDETGVKVEDLSVQAVADAILQGIELANDPSNRNKNRETIRSKASEEYVKDAALEFYR